jgi:hypothetical protein
MNYFFKKKTRWKQNKNNVVNGLNMGQKTMVVVSFYLLFAAIYGTIKLFKDIMEYF